MHSSPSHTRYLPSEGGSRETVENHRAHPVVMGGRLEPPPWIWAHLSRNHIRNYGNGFAAVCGLSCFFIVVIVFAKIIFLFLRIRMSFDRIRNRCITNLVFFLIRMLLFLKIRTRCIQNMFSEESSISCNFVCFFPNSFCRGLHRCVAQAGTNKQAKNKNEYNIRTTKSVPDTRPNPRPTKSKAEWILLYPQKTTIEWNTKRYKRICSN